MTNDRLETRLWLAAANEIVGIVGDLVTDAAVFRPLSKEPSANVNLLYDTADGSTVQIIARKGPHRMVQLNIYGRNGSRGPIAGIMVRDGIDEVEITHAGSMFRLPLKEEGAGIAKFVNELAKRVLNAQTRTSPLD